MEFLYLLFLKLIFTLNSPIKYSTADIAPDYLEQRNDIIKQEELLAFGGKIKLAGDEIPANECLMYFKRKEVDAGFKDPTKFLPSRNFLQVRNQIEDSPVFKIIQKAPKGGNFHAHSSAIVSAPFIIKNITYEPNLYICLEGKSMRFRFFKTPDQGCNWELLSNLRKNDATIDSKIERALILPVSKQTNVNEAWSEFQNMFDVIRGLITYRPLFERHMIQSMNEHLADKVMFMEIRSSLAGIYDLEGNYYDELTVAKLYKQISDEYRKAHPDFLGVKVIYAVSKSYSREGLERMIEVYKEVKAALPDFVIGFDLVGQEDRLPTLLSRIEQLRKLNGGDASFFFHAGETKWYGHSSDANLYDAVLLHTKRIGHGFALPKHPKLMEMVKQRKIAVEVSPISNQVLNLVSDMRNHPASILFAEDMPVVVSNDDPGFWDAEGLSYDFYEAFVGIMSRDADLRALKQLALNSIEYSSLTKLEMVKGREIFDGQWKRFTRDLLDSQLCAQRT